MPKLTEIKTTGNFIITQITAEQPLQKRLAEMGLILGKTLTLISPCQANTGLIIYFQGQRLALSADLAKNIQVLALTSSTDVSLTTLDCLKPDKQCLIKQIAGQTAFKQRIMEMGLTKGTLVTVTKLAPLGDPIELKLRGYKLSIRKEDAKAITVQEVTI